MDRKLCFKNELIEAGEKISDHGDQDLGEHCVGSRAEEPLDLQVLLDAFEEQCDLPACLVDVRDSHRRKFEVVGQERICLARLGVDITDASLQDAILCIGLKPGVPPINSIPCHFYLLHPDPNA